MTFHVVVQSEARRMVMNKLPVGVAGAVISFLEAELVENPRRVGKALRAPRLGQWSARRGEYRIIYTIDDSAQLVRVLRIDHRRDIYR